MGSGGIWNKDEREELGIGRKRRNWKSGGKGGIGNKDEREELEIRRKGRNWK
jgi:hypothetical protein